MSKATAPKTAPLAGIEVAVLAGGLGSRIRAVLGDDLPKVLAPVGDRPFLAHLLNWLESFGARRVVLCLGHLAQTVEAWLASQPPRRLEVVCVVEPYPQGTAGALRFARPALRTDTVLVMNGDTFIDTDLGAFVAAHAAAQTEASVLCVTVDDVGRYGQVDVDKAGRIQRFAEKTPDNHAPGLINAGLYLFDAVWLDRLAASKAVSLEREVLMAAPAGTLNAVPCAGRFIDIGTPQSLNEATSILAKNTATSSPSVDISSFKEQGA